MDHPNALQLYLKELNVDPNATSIYIYLLKSGPSSALQIAKSTRLSRTQAYRHLDSLKVTGLVSSEPLSYGTMFRALPFENIDAALANNEAKTAALRQDLGSMIEFAHELTGSAGKRASIQHHYGLAGLKQVNWNLTKANGEYRVFEAAHLSHHLDRAFARRCRDRYLERKLVSYDLTNETEALAKDLEPFEPARTHIRHVDPSVLSIKFEVYIYNDVVTLLDYSQDQEMAMEIHHPALNIMMQQLFDAVWIGAKPLDIT